MKNTPFASFRDFIPRSFELVTRSGKAYSRDALLRDLVAGLTVGVIALPLAMAFSIAAGGTPEQGLYTAIIAGFFVSLLGGSKYQIGGPTGAFVVIILGVIQKHGMDGLFTAGMLAGIMLVLMGISGLGKLIKFIPYPVTTGFTSGIGLLIFSQQLKDLFGFQIENSSPDFLQKWAEYLQAFTSFNPSSLALGGASIVLIFVIKKFVPRIPGAALAVAAATAAAVIFKLPAETIGTRFGGLDPSFPHFVLPSFRWDLVKAVFPDAMTIALLAAIESLLSAVVADGMTGDRHNSNTELLAQGIGNIASVCFTGIPATGAIARTAANIKSGACSPIAGIIHALVLLLFLLFLSPLAAAIPLAALSAVLIVVAWDMSDLGRFFSLIKKAPKSDTIILLSTFLLTVLMDLTVAVQAGMVMAAFLFMRRMTEVADIRKGSTQLGAKLVYGDDNSPGSKTHEIPTHAKDIELYEITGPFFFGVADMLQSVLEDLEKPPRIFILRMREVPAIDATGMTALENFYDHCRRKKTRLIISELQEQPRKALKHSGFLGELGEQNIRNSLEEALQESSVS